MEKFKKYNELLCEEFCEEMKKFEVTRSPEHLQTVKDLAETWADLQCIEAGEAMRKIARREYGYGDDMSDWDEEAIYAAYNAGRGGRGNRRRSRETGRFISNRGGQGGMYNAYDEEEMYNNMYPPMYMERDMYNRGNQGGRGGRGTNNRGGRGGRGTYNQGSDGGRGGSDGQSGTYNTYGPNDPNQMYMLRQQDGMPIWTPYAHGDKPKKLTKEQYKEWVDDMVNADGSNGAHWTMEQTKQVQKKLGFDDVDECAFWTAMNASYSDLCGFFKKHNIDNPEAYAEYAMEFWFEDEDAVGGGEPGNVEKLAAYYNYVVEK